MVANRVNLSRGWPSRFSTAAQCVGSSRKAATLDWQQQPLSQRQRAYSDKRWHRFVVAPARGRKCENFISNRNGEADTDEHRCGHNDAPFAWPCHRSCHERGDRECDRRNQEITERCAEAKERCAQRSFHRTLRGGKGALRATATGLACSRTTSPAAFPTRN